MSKNIWVIYDKNTTQILRIRTRNGRTTEWYYGESAAKAALTRYSKQSGLMPTDADYPLYHYALADRDHYYKNIERQVKRKNLMTGAEYMESVNTPLSCSPASETYWTM
jgi:hypothetical protein